MCIIERAVGLKSDDTRILGFFFQNLPGKLLKPSELQWKWACPPVSENGSEIRLDDSCESA